MPLRKSAQNNLGAGICLLSLALAILISSAFAPIREAASRLAVVQTAAKSPDAQPCLAEGKIEIAIDCAYSEAPVAASNGQDGPQVVLNRAKLSFHAKDDSHMRVELTFTNASKRAIADERTVYLAIDDASGQNHVRRQLPSVDFRKLAPGEPATFVEILRAPAFQPGRYTISLWIPSSDPSFKFDPSHNFLLGNSSVRDEKSGLNTLATFTVVR